MDSKESISRILALALATLAVAGASGCVTVPVAKPIVTMKTLPPDRCLPQFGAQAHETITNSGPTCVIWTPNTAMKKAERRHLSALQSLSKFKGTDVQKKIKADQFRSAWLREANSAAERAVCPTGMRKAADFQASAVTCTARLELEAVTK